MRLRKAGLILAMGLSACGPNEPPHAVTGAIIGGVGGAAIGAGASGTPASILIGAGAGAVAGAIVGSFVGDDHTPPPNFVSAEPNKPSQFRCMRHPEEVSYQPLQYDCTDDSNVTTRY